MGSGESGRWEVSKCGKLVREHFSSQNVWSLACTAVYGLRFQTLVLLLDNRTCDSVYKVATYSCRLAEKWKEVYAINKSNTGSKRVYKYS